ncbi:hypothetical protein [Marivita sp.]
MFTALAQTLFRASGVSPTHVQKDIPQSWYREDLQSTSKPKRWEDWK